MKLHHLALLSILLGCVYTAPAIRDDQEQKVAEHNKEDLIASPSTSYGHGYSNLGGYNTGYQGYSGYGATGYGLVDDKYNSYYGQGGYDSGLGYGGYSGIGGYGGYNGGYGGQSGYGGYKGYSGIGGYGGYKGYSGIGGYGGYGGNGGNGGLNSYYGYNNPYYNGANNLGYGYYKKSSFYGPVTPSLVTGYRGYSR